MKQLSFAILPVLVGLVITLSAFKSPTLPAEKKYSSIEQLVGDERLKTVITGLGGYQEECVELNLKNLTRDTLFVELESGRRLVSKDTNEQDILVVKRRRIILAPLAALIVNVYGFCCQSKKHGPAKASVFSIGYMAPPEWQKVTQLMDEHAFPVDAMQSAIWVLSDNHDISSIYNEKPETIQLLKNTVARIKNLEVPWYSVVFETDPTAVFSNRALKVTGELAYNLSTNAIITINVRDRSGVLVTNLEKGLSRGPGEYTDQLAINVKGWPKGTYEICVYEDYSRLIKKVVFQL